MLDAENKSTESKSIKNIETKNVTILGATGTIGLNAADVILHNNQNPNAKIKYNVNTVIAGSNYQKLAQQAVLLGAKKAVIFDVAHYKNLKAELSGKNIEILAGEEAVLAASADKTDLYLAGSVGFCALKPVISAISAGNKIGLANKECLVCAGQIMTDLADKNNVKLIPIDSEHNSIYQVFDFERTENITKMILTASGGPFLNMDKAELENVTPQMAVKHPNWNMGAKISVDSASMMNKGLEVIEAHYLFKIPQEKIDVLVHPQSVIHGIVEYNDGSQLAGLSNPDMRIPISYALAHPSRIESNSKFLNLAEIGNLSFSAPDYEKFRCLKLALEALRAGQTHAIALNAANELAVAAFLEGQISFTQIADVVSGVLDKISAKAISAPKIIDEVFEIDNYSRVIAKEMITQKNKAA